MDELTVIPTPPPHQIILIGGDISATCIGGLHQALLNIISHKTWRGNDSLELVLHPTTVARLEAETPGDRVGWLPTGTPGAGPVGPLYSTPRPAWLLVESNHAPATNGDIYSLIEMCRCLNLPYAWSQEQPYAPYGEEHDSRRLQLLRWWAPGLIRQQELISLPSPDEGLLPDQLCRPGQIPAAKYAAATRLLCLRDLPPFSVSLERRVLTLEVPFLLERPPGGLTSVAKMTEYRDEYGGLYAAAAWCPAASHPRGRIPDTTPVVYLDLAPTKPIEELSPAAREALMLAATELRALGDPLYYEREYLLPQHQYLAPVYTVEQFVDGAITGEALIKRLRNLQDVPQVQQWLREGFGGIVATTATDDSTAE